MEAPLPSPSSTITDTLVLITEATGHLGFKVLRTALEEGYHVRAVVRSEQKATPLKSNNVLKATPGFSNLSFNIVPDFLTPGAFDEAAKDTKYILHVASPIVTKLPRTTTMMPTASNLSYKAL